MPLRNLLGFGVLMFSSRTFEYIYVLYSANKKLGQLYKITTREFIFSLEVIFPSNNKRLTTEQNYRLDSHLLEESSPKISGIYLK